MRIATFVVLGLASWALAACSKPPEAPATLPPPAEPEINLVYQEIPPVSRDYPLKACAVCDKDFATLGHPPLAIAYKAYEVRVCDKKCLREYAKDPQGIILRKINPKAMFDR